FPIHVVTAWIGNTVKVAMKHYLQVTDADFDRAAGVKEKISEPETVAFTDARDDARPSQTATRKPTRSIPAMSRQSCQEPHKALNNQDLRPDLAETGE